MDAQTIFRVVQIILIIYVAGNIFLFLRNAKYMSSKRALGKMLYHCIWFVATYFGFNYINTLSNKFINSLAQNKTANIVEKAIPIYALVLTIFYAFIAIVKIIKESKRNHPHKNSNNYKNTYNDKTNKSNKVAQPELHYDDSVIIDRQNVCSDVKEEC